MSTVKAAWRRTKERVLRMDAAKRRALLDNYKEDDNDVIDDHLLACHLLCTGAKHHIDDIGPAFVAMHCVVESERVYIQFKQCGGRDSVSTMWAKTAPTPDGSVKIHADFDTAVLGNERIFQGLIFCSVQELRNINV